MVEVGRKQLARECKSRVPAAPGLDGRSLRPPCEPSISPPPGSPAKTDGGASPGSRAGRKPKTTLTATTHCAPPETYCTVEDSRKQHNTRSASLHSGSMQLLARTVFVQRNGRGSLRSHWHPGLKVEPQGFVEARSHGKKGKHCMHGKLQEGTAKTRPTTAHIRFRSSSESSNLPGPGCLLWRPP